MIAEFIVAAAMSAAAAPPALPERLRSGPTQKQQVEGRKVLMSFGECVADAEPALARDYVLTDGADTDSPEWNDLVDPRCMRLHGGELRMQSFFFRGALAERLIDKKLPQDALDKVADLAPLNATFPGDDPFAQNYTYMYRIGECVVRTDTASARELLSTRIDSKDEADAIRTLSPAISGCVPQGEQVQIDRVRLRLGLATMYYRLADALAPESEA
mgnify:CR=1 FL=1